MAEDVNDWWRGAIVYQVYPRSFCDSNGDGIGDLAGITGKLGYIKDLGADAVWISPFFKSPMKDFGYDVSDYEAVDPIFGTTQDFDSLVATARECGLKVIIDLVISHTSNEHKWFQESRSSRNNPKADWYVWADPQPDGSPPNNWLSVFGGSAWEWDSTRRQYYLHNFLRSQPDLNFHNAEVQHTMLETARFWLEKGVQGFRLDAVNFYFHDRQLRSNPPRLPDEVDISLPDTNPYHMQHHLYDKSQPDNLLFLERFRALLDKYPGTMTVGEIGEGEKADLMASYTEGKKRLHMAYSFALLGKPFSAAYIRGIVEEHERALGSGWPCWAFNNHDVTRAVTRWNARPDDRAAFARMLAALLLCLRGSISLYQGEELGLPEADIPYERLQDPYGIQFWPEYKGRDGCRTPMPWEASSPHAGFSTVEPWLPVSGQHSKLAVDVQLTHEQSVLKHYQRFISWRKQFPALQKGEITFIDAVEPLIAFLRNWNGMTILVVINLGRDAVDFTLPDAMRIQQVLQGHGFNSTLQERILQLPTYSAFFAQVNQA